MTDTDMITGAVRRWRMALAEQPDDAIWVPAAREAAVAAGLAYKGKQPVLHVAEPTFMTEAMLAEDQAVVDAVLSALVAAGERILDDEDWRGRYLAGWFDTIGDVDLFAVPTGYRSPIVMGRLDGARLSDGLHILEFNGGLPGGVQPADVSASVMSSWPCARAFAAAQPYRTLDAATAMVRTVIATWHDFGGSGLPTTVVALPGELREVASPALAHLSAAATALGIDLRVADPGELRHEARRLRLADEPVDVLVRAFFTTMLTYLGPRLDGIRSALRAGDLCMITSLRSGVYGLKSLFAAVTDPDVDLDLPAATAAKARAHLPWTRIVTPGPITDAEGARGDIAQVVSAQREQLVIKPIDGFGGAGVELGWKHTDDSWRAVLDSALADGGRIVQARVPLAREEYSSLEPGFAARDFTADHNPIIGNGEIVGYFVRLTPDEGVTNVTAGAGVAPTFILQ